MRFHEITSFLAEKAPVTIGTLTPLTRDQVMDALIEMGYEDIKINGNKLIVLTQIPDGEEKTKFRKAIQNEILQQCQIRFKEFNPKITNASGYGTLGGITFEGSPVAILIKDSGNQGDQSAGVGNEIELASFIQSVIEKYGSATVSFVDPTGKKMTIKDCTTVDIAGRDTSQRKKADVVLKSAKGGSLPISIKKLNADMWESADSLFGPKAKTILEKLQREGAVQLTQLKDDKGRIYYRLNKEIVVEPTEEEAMNAIFGSDLNPKGGVVIQTFKPEHYRQEGNQITVECHAVITNKEEIPESHLMVWLIRNNQERNNPLPGLRTLGVTLTRGIGKKGTKDVLLVDRNGNIVENPNKEYIKPKKQKEPELEPGSVEATRTKR